MIHVLNTGLKNLQIFHITDLQFVTRFYIRHNVLS